MPIRIEGRILSIVDLTSLVFDDHKPEPLSSKPYFVAVTKGPLPD
jgi:hypothetical protein